MTNDYELRDATWDDLPKIAEVMCPMDHAELFAASGLTPSMALWLGFRYSTRCRVGCYKGRPQIIYGVTPRNGIGVIWMAGASLVPHAKFVLQTFESELRLVAGDCKYLTNYMDYRQTVHRRLLERRGFVFDDSDVQVHRGVTFVKFIRRMD